MNKKIKITKKICSKLNLAGMDIKEIYNELKVVKSDNSKECLKAITTIVEEYKENTNSELINKEELNFIRMNISTSKNFIIVGLIGLLAMKNLVGKTWGSLTSKVQEELLRNANVNGTEEDKIVIADDAVIYNPTN